MIAILFTSILKTRKSSKISTLKTLKINNYEIVIGSSGTTERI